MFSRTEFIDLDISTSKDEQTIRIFSSQFEIFVNNSFNCVFKDVSSVNIILLYPDTPNNVLSLSLTSPDDISLKSFSLVLWII